MWRGSRVWGSYEGLRKVEGAGLRGVNPRGGGGRGKSRRVGRGEACSQYVFN